MSTTSIPAGLERRKEDYGLITGRSRYVDDLRSPEKRPSALFMAVVRSPYAHAKIESINLETARKMPGVVAALESKELVGNMPAMDVMPMPPKLKKPQRRPLAIDRVRYVGDPVAIVLAESSYAAEDARDLIEVDYTPLQAVSDPELAASSDATLLYDDLGTNVAFHVELKEGDIEAAFEKADHVVRLRLVNQRLAPSSLEPRACMFDFDTSTGQFSAWLSSQSVFRAREALAKSLGLDPKNVHIRNAEVGGAFGAKTTFVGEELAAAALALKYGRPVKWIETRSENLQSQTQGRGEINYVEAACQKDGLLLGLRVRSLADLGAFLSGATAMVPSRMPSMLSGPYQLKALDSEMVGVFTNKVPTAPYRGAGRPEATYVLERTMGSIASELGLDPADVRRRNFISADAFPYKTVTHLEYDSGNYSAALEQALELIDYKGWQAKREERRKANSSKLLGIGLSTFIEVSGGPMSFGPNAPQEAATVRIRRDGTILVQSGVATNGQGHYTAFAQIAANTFHMPGNEIEVQMNDASLPVFGIGTFGSRTLQTAGSAVVLAAEALREKALNLAARELEASLRDLEIENGRVSVRGVPSKMIELKELARLAEEEPSLIEHEAPNPVNGAPIEGLAAWRDFNPSNSTFPSGTHIAVIEVDTDTGEAHILQYVAVDDCGRILNHYLVDAQVHGSLTQGIGQALFEEVVYGEDGQLLSGTLMDYALPVAFEMPSFMTESVETPSPINPLGAKGVGESGCIAAPPAVVNAVLDALRPLGIKTIDMPMKPEKIWQLVHAAQAGTLAQNDFKLPTIFDKSNGQD